jgi:hypothetical protein
VLFVILDRRRQGEEKDGVVREWMVQVYRRNFGRSPRFKCAENRPVVFLVPLKVPAPLQDGAAGSMLTTSRKVPPEPVTA